MSLRIARNSVMAIALAGLLCACGADPGGTDPGADGSATAVTAASRASAGGALADMVTAVSGSGPSAPVDLKFNLVQRPEVGQPATIELAIIPVGRLERVLATFQGSDGLEVSSGAQMPQVERPDPNVPMMHRLTVVPKQDGLFYVQAVVLADSREESLARTFTIPLIAGAGLAAGP